MTVRVDPTPNPNAMKFSVGTPVGGPGTFVKGSESPKGFIGNLLDIDGVGSIFFTADFVTISKTPSGTWESIIPLATAILEAEFGE